MADIFNLTDTWTVGGTTYTAVKMNVTDTASATGSLIMDMQLAGVSHFSVRKDGTVVGGKAFTVATLPAAGVQGRRAWVTDATTPTFLGALTGGGTVKTPVFDNGTAWVSA